MAKKQKKQDNTKNQQQKAQAEGRKEEVADIAEEIMIVSDVDHALLVDSWDNPPEPNEKLVTLMESRDNKDKIIKVPLYTIDEATHNWIDGFQEHWLPGIRVRATLMGMVPPDLYSEEDWRNLFISWGGSGILKK